MGERVSASVYEYVYMISLSLSRTVCRSSVSLRGALVMATRLC